MINILILNHKVNKGDDNRMELAKEYIEKLLASSQKALKELDKDDEKISEIDIQKSLGWLDDCEQRILAAKIILREDMKEIRSRNRQ